jgi:hypothetical protein
MMAPAEEGFGGIALHFQRLNTRHCDEIWAGGGGYGYHGQTCGVVQECLVRLLEIPWAWNFHQSTPCYCQQKKSILYSILRIRHTLRFAKIPPKKS